MKRLCSSLFLLLLVIVSIKAVEVNLNFYADGQKIHTAKVESGNSYTLSTLLNSAGISVTGCRGYNFIGWKQDGPVESGETPTTVNTVTPQTNLNLYAVYQKTGANANRYTRITSTSDLRVGDKYLIVCYYEWDGDIYYGPSYFALGNSQSEGVNDIVYETGDTYYSYDVYAERYSLSATQLYPQSGVIDNPSNTLIWTLSGSDDAWKWTNSSANKSLYIRRGYGQKYYSNNGIYPINGQSYNEQLLTTTGGTCSITATNGVFNFQSGSYFLTYSDDEEDYFCMGRSNDWTFYLYRKESPYTSFPNCTNWTVHLDALDGTISGTSPAASTTDIEEASAGSGVTLPTASMSGSDCASWVFSGWHAESAIYGTTTQPNLHTSTYSPIYNGEKLYAVYQAGENATYYEKVSSKSELSNGDVCVIVYTGNNKAVTYYNASSWSATDVSVSGNRITSTVNNRMEWTYNSSENSFFYGSTPLAYNNNYYLLTNTSTPFKLKYQTTGRWSTTYYLRWNGSQFANSDTDSQNTYTIYKKVTTYATYSSYPHCTPYSVTLYGCGGTISGDVTRTITEATAGSGIELPDATPRCPEDGWSFAGWLEGDELGSVEDVDFTGLYTGSYAPARDGVKLYAVFKRKTDLFKIISGSDEIVSGDTYLITYYASDGGSEKYDFMLSSTPSGSYLKGIKGEAPQNGEGYYMIASDSTVMWQISSSGSSWTIQNLDNHQYLYLGTDGTTSTTASSNTISITDRDGLAMYVANGNYRMYYSNGVFHTQYSTGTSYFCYIYRRANEYTSWPHCDPFTVNFDGCGGSAGETSLTESAAYAGVVLPNAYANSDCRKEGWEFAGWATSPVSEESSTLPQDLLPAGTTYYPVLNNATLYAVYQVKENTYKRVTAKNDLRTGINYIIATTGNRAISNTAYNTHYVASQTVSPAANVITSDNANIIWRLQGNTDTYELYNADRSKYLDLSTSGYALLTDEAEDNFVITYASGAFYVRSIMAISDSKYLGFTSPYFNTVESTSAVALYFYQQQATYHSYPSCVEAVDALRWEADHVYVESYSLSGEPDMDKSIGDPVAQADGTWRINYNEVLTPCTKVTVAWNGETSKITVPYVASTTTDIATLTGGVDCTECDLVVLPNTTLTINQNTTLHNLTVYEGGKLLISNNITLSVHSLVMYIDGDESQAPEVQFGGANAKLDVQLGEIYLDRRLDEEDWYWFTLPYSAQLQEISYSNLAANNNTAPVYRTDYFIKYYDGATRAADINAGNRKDTYWTHVAAAGSDYTLQAGQGYIIGIADQKNTVQADGRKHTKRVLRFTMKPESNWNTQEKGTGKITTVTPSTIAEERLAYNAGWNLIGNPYMHTYNTGTVGGSAGIRNGAWTEELNDEGKWTGQWILDDNRDKTVPYISFFNRSTQQYEQVLANNCNILPFNAFFVQIEEDTQVNFASNMNASRLPAYKRFLQEETPVYTGIQLTGKSGKDQTGVVLSPDYSSAYEIGADLEKMENGGKINVYTLSEGIKLAFNGLSETEAAAIPVGVALPQSGDYTFSFDLQYNPLQIDTLLLTDHALGITTNLLLQEYRFTAEKGTDNTRFTLKIRTNKDSKQPNTPTADNDMQQTGIWCAGVKDGILLNNPDDAADVRIFDMTGKQVYNNTQVAGMQHFTLPQGVYNIQLLNNKKTTTLRAIVK